MRIKTQSQFQESQFESQEFVIIQYTSQHVYNILCVTVIFHFRVVAGWLADSVSLSGPQE